ncbi:ATP-binding protein [Paenibacillus sp. sgz302251]|uniref:ATP-binding protein n=1 Tax=Paenibacillus sp. sgz302251 TaxID=3414493 RepID=UPI003C7DEAF4
MANPVYVAGDFQWDLRSIPLLVSIIYSSGKYVPGIISAFIAIVYQIYIGGEIFVLAIFGYISILGPSFFFVRKFPDYAVFKRVVISILLSVNAFLIIQFLLYIYLKLYGHQLHLSIDVMYLFALISTFALVSVIGMWISALLNEHIIESTMLKLELERNEKLKIVSQIAASVAHEVRNPLTVVKGFLQLLKESVDDKKRDYLKIALSELERAEFIITDYLNLAKPQADQLEVIEVSGFLQSTLEIMNSYGLIQNVQLHFYCEQTDLYIMAEKPKLSQVILNLIKNGVEAIPETGDVTVNAYYRNEVIYIEIMDTGKGMSKADLDQIGTAFFTTKGSGTGLGILVTMRIVEAMNGKITYESNLGRGTKVTIRLPAVHP